MSTRTSICEGQYIPALIEPAFVTVDVADTWLDDAERVLLARVKEDVHVYPLSLMKTHEVVNDVVGGRPIIAAFCPLADLGAVYDREIGGEIYTFGVSGYTYYEWLTWRGYSAFVLWDRETESLWWPPIGKAVSGPSVDVPMRVLERDLWAQSTWVHVKRRYPQARVLALSQDFVPPESWERKAAPAVKRVSGKPSGETIAPRWGENSDIE